jgi:hypothetical protein
MRKALEKREHTREKVEKVLRKREHVIERKSRKSFEKKRKM